MENLQPDDCLVIDGVYHHSNTPTDEDVSAFARIAVSVFNNGPDDRPDYFVSVDVYEYNLMLSAVSDDIEDGIEQVGSVSGPKFSAFHSNPDGARKLAEQLIAVADGVELLEATKRT